MADRSRRKAIVKALEWGANKGLGQAPVWEPSSMADHCGVCAVVGIGYHLATMKGFVCVQDGEERPLVELAAELTGETLDRLQSRQRGHRVHLGRAPFAVHARAQPLQADRGPFSGAADHRGYTLPSQPGLHVVASLGEARIQVREIAESVRYQRKAGLPARVAPY